VLEIIQGKTTVAQAAREFDLTPSEIGGWQVRKRAVGHRPRIQALPSVAQAPDERWATDLCRVWGGREGWLTLALVIDCHTRQLLGWQLSRSGKARQGKARQGKHGGGGALEQALIARFGTPGRVRTPFLLRSTMGWSSPVVATRGWCAAMGCSKNSSHHIVHSRTA